MANKRISYFNGYQATAASGVDPYTDEISVDVLPDTNDWARDSFAMPLSIGDYHVIVTGWQQSPPKLWIDPCGVSVSGPVDVLCAPSADAMVGLQSLQVVSHVISSPGDVVYLETGVLNYVEVNAAGTLGWRYGQSGSVPGVVGMAQTTPTTKFHRGVTRVVLYDVDGDQPTLTWSGAPVGASIHWASGAAAFAAGKSFIQAEILAVGAGGITLSLGTYDPFA
jgi:hypothetical protein